MINLHHLQHFTQVYQSGGIREASRRFHASPASLSRSVNLIEEAYRVQLFNRIGKELEATAFGDLLYRESKTLLAGFDNLGESLNSLKVLEKGSLRLGVSPVISHFFLKRVTRQLVQDYPGLEVTVTIGQSDELIDALVNHEQDLIVSHATPMLTRTDLDIVPVFEEVANWFVRADHPQAREKHPALEVLSRYPLLTQNLPSPFLEWLEALARELRHAGGIKHSLSCSNYDTLLSILLQSDAIALLPQRLVEASAVADRLHRLDLPTEHRPFMFSAAVRHGVSILPAAQICIDLFKGVVDPNGIPLG